MQVIDDIRQYIGGELSLTADDCLHYINEGANIILGNLDFQSICDKLSIPWPWKPVRDLVYVRELPVEQEGLIISPIDLNRSTDNTTYLQGIVEAVGPKVRDLKVGDRVWFEIHAGEFRIPGDDMVRIMYEGQITGVEGEGAACK
jgi:co-chaperonin GroES (HSP10)